ncbi:MULTISPECIES: hypothetical protein [Flavihumibacter]|uniref:Lamin tail-like protein n=1 Tax=Flavihumibacter fluminis TaxID=2909236 RepID=A0ABS9BH09_9BACT|nr:MULTISPECIES: hypothetical protein [Flavihumibacter]MCF1714423.1 hypothetical protein [Flavihumibacter fluminis]MCG7754460.1 hypothetical protein [Flavihumibacter cheonanensis]
MNKILKSSIVLLFFSTTIFIIQVSCQKTSDAQSGGSTYILPTATSSRLGGIIVGEGLDVTNNGTLSVKTTTSAAPSLIFFSRSNPAGTRGDEIWKANIDGSNPQKLNITLPSGYLISLNQATPETNGSAIVVTTDQKIIFRATISSAPWSSLFSCDFNGSNVVKLLDNVGTSYAIY